MICRYTVCLAAILTLSACASGPSSTDQGAGAAVGGVLGAVTATAFGANTEQLVFGTIMGAAAGAAIGQQKSTTICSYPKDDGTYYRASC